MKKIFLLVAFWLQAGYFIAQTPYSKEVEEQIKQVENNITGRIVLNDEKPSTIVERMAKYNVKGLSIAVIYDHKIAWAKAYGSADEAEKKPMTTETLFEPGSISKSLNALGILKLAQDKKVDLNTDINHYLLSWKFPYDSLSKEKKITLTHLLSHNAGLTVHGFPGHDINAPIPTVLEVLDGKKPSFTPAVRSMYEPGLKFQYSGGGTTISQLLLTDVTKQIYDVWMYENILKPIGMVNSSYSQPPSKDKRALCASAYRSDGTPVANKFHVYPEQGAAGLWMTPSDLCNYIIDMQLAYQGKPSKVLNPEMVKLHLTPYNNGPTALGTFIEDHGGAKYFQHGAGNDGFCGQFFGSLDDGYGVAIFMNTDDPKLLPEVINSVAKTYNWKNFYQAPRLKKSVAVKDNILKTYEGVYVFENIWGVILKKDDDYYLHSTGTYAKMYFSSPTGFFNEEFSSEKEFVKNDKGNVVGYTRKVGHIEHQKATKVNADTLQMKLEDLNAVCWVYIENKKFAEATPYLNRGLHLYPGDLVLLCNRAHVDLFTGNYKSAIDVYKAHFKETASNNMIWEEMIKEDFKYLKKQGFDSKAMDKVFAELKLEKPEGY